MVQEEGSNRVKDIKVLTKKVQVMEEQEGPQIVEELKLLHKRVGVMLEQEDLK